MSTGTVDLSPLMAHVPVDRFDMVDGPGAIKCMSALEQLTNPLTEYVDLVFTLKTAASIEPFRRNIKMATIFSVEDGAFAFNAVFCGKVVSGIYNMKTRRGWFNLD